MIKQSKHILFIINGLGIGGAETHLLRLSKALANKGYQVNILTISKDLTLLDRLDKRVNHINIPLRKSPGLIADIRKILKTVKQLEPDVIHAHLFQANIISRLIKFFYPSIRNINTTHGSYLLNTRSYNPYKIYRYTKKWVDFHTAVSQEVLQLLWNNKSIEKSKSTYIPNGLFTKDYFNKKNKQTGKFKWISVGRLHPVKNYDNLIKVFSEIKNKFPGFTLDIAGGGSEKENLQTTIDTYQLNDNIKLLGSVNVNNVPELLSEYDAFVISSDSEGLPMVLLEAMASSLPVVSTDVGEIGNILSESKGGILIPPKNNDKLKEALLKMMSLTQEERINKGNYNRKFIEKKFDIEKLIDTWIYLYFNN